jgi:hypothetical protein
MTARLLSISSQIVCSSDGNGRALRLVFVGEQPFLEVLDATSSEADIRLPLSLEEATQFLQEKVLTPSP